MMKRKTKNALALLLEKGESSSKKGGANLRSDDGAGVIDSGKMLNRGQLIAIKPHRPFLYCTKHKHNYVELVYMCTGETTHIINDSKVVLKTGELLFLNQHATQEVLPCGQDDIAINFIILPGFFNIVFAMMPDNNYIKDFLVDSVVGSRADYIHFQVSDVIPIQNLVENLIWSLLNKQSNKYFSNQTTMALLFIHLIGHTDKLRSSRIYEDSLIFSVLRYIDENYKNAYLDVVAKQLMKPVPWLSRFIKLQTGKTFTELLQHKRINQAAFLLTTSKMPIMDIVVETGYENASYFFKIFKQQFGMTPLQFRVSRQNEFGYARPS